MNYMQVAVVEDLPGNKISFTVGYTLGCYILSRMMEMQGLMVGTLVEEIASMKNMTIFYA